MGAFILTQPGRVGQWLVLLIAGYLVITNALDIYVGLSGSAPGGSNGYRLLGGGIGLTAGLLVLLVPLATSVTLPALIVILAIGLLATGLVGLAASLLAREDTGIRWGRIVADLLRVVFGGLLLSLGGGAGGDVLRWLGIIAVVGGGALVAYALLLSRRPAAVT